MIYNKRQIGLKVAVVLLLCAWSLAVENPLPTFASAASLLLCLGVLQKSGCPKAVVMAVCFQWTQVFLPIANANAAGGSLAEDFRTRNLETAAFLGLLAVVFFSLGASAAACRKSVIEISSQQSTLNPKRVLVAYMLAHLLTVIAEYLGGAIPSLRQPLATVGMLRWAMVYLIFVKSEESLVMRRLGRAVLALEVLLGLSGFFSEFKHVFFVAIVASLNTKSRYRKNWTKTAMLAAGVLALIVFWQSIKSDYRQFVNEGTGEQVVLKSYEERLGFLAQRISSLNVQELQSGFQSGVERTGYIEYLARAISIVPHVVPYQGGILWLEALEHTLMPRALFPNKPQIDDSVRVNQFCGVSVGGAEVGTSVSLGYVAESYIDFGVLLMWVPIFIVGAMWVCFYRKIESTGSFKELATGMATSMVLDHAIFFEMSNIKILGGGVVSFLGATLFLALMSNNIRKYLLGV